MEINLDTNNSIYQIRSYEPGKIVINDQSFSNPLMIVTPTELVASWHVKTVHALTANDLTRLLAFKPQVVLLGSGEKMVFVAPDVTAPLLTKHIGVEVMDTKAACRTFNVLAAEGRNVVAVLFL